MRFAAIVTKEGKATLAEFPDAPGCQTHVGPGESIEESATEALEGWLESSLANGDVVSRPSRRAPRAGRGARVLWVEVSPKLALQVELRHARHAAHLTQAALAKRAGVSQQAIARLEDPDANPTIETLARVAAALGVRLRIVLEAPGVPSHG